jgi:hypothetical protein
MFEGSRIETMSPSRILTLSVTETRPLGSITISMVSNCIMPDSGLYLDMLSIPWPDAITGNNDSKKSV